MQYAIKVSISVAIILLCTVIGRKLPSLAGLIAVMPLTGALVMVWLYSDLQGNTEKMLDYTRGAVWGILPSVLFFVAAYFCFKRSIGLPITLAVSFGIWGIAAFVHQLILRG